MHRHAVADRRRAVERLETARCRRQRGHKHRRVGQWTGDGHQPTTTLAMRSGTTMIFFTWSALDCPLHIIEPKDNLFNL